MDPKLRLDAEYVKEHQNRGLDTKDEENKTVSIGLMDIDTAIIDYMKTVIKPNITDLADETRIEVPVLYALPERWKTLQKDSIQRDKFEKFTQVPMLMLKRDSIRRGALNNPVNKYLERNFDSVGWNKRNKYDRFAAVNGIKPSQRYVSVMMPDYYDLVYSCIIWTPTIQQVNEVIEQISFEAENYWGERNKYKFKTSVEEFTDSTQLPDNSDRIVRAEFQLKVHAYLLAESTIDKFGNPTKVQQTRFTPKKLTIKETVVRDINDLDE